MRGLLAVFGGLFGLLLVPLALSAPTAWLLLPVHAVFTGLATAGALAEGWTGHPNRARAWGVGYVLASLAMVASLELGADVRDAGSLYWGAPWLATLVWGWVPPSVAGLSGWIGELRRRRKNRRILLRRRR